MKLKKVGSTKAVEVSVNKYLVDWDAECRSIFQRDVKQFFKKYWSNHKVLEEFRLPGSLLRVDLVNLNKKLLVETNGKQHEEYNKHFHKGSRVNFLKQIQRDQQKRDWAEANGFTMIEIEPKDLPLSLEFFRKQFNVEII
jgi:very-short-patch-repair endonuclease